jgi:hypothetical protein
MSSSTRETAETVREHLANAEFSVKRADNLGKKIKDPALHRKIAEVKEAIERADEHVKRGLEQ